MIMKILAFTDFHGSPSALKKIMQKAKKEKPDVLVCPGDFTIFEQHMHRILKKMDSMGIPLLLIPGNHESSYTLRNEVKRYKNLVYLHKTFCRMGKYLFIGYGEGGFSLTDKSFKTWGDKMMKKVRKDDYVTLLVHGPPHGTKLDEVMGEYCGNKDYTKFISKYKIPLVFCGHIHENFEKEDKIGRSRVINPGPFGKIFLV